MCACERTVVQADEGHLLVPEGAGGAVAGDVAWPPAGVRVIAGARLTGDGSYGAVVRDPGGDEIELVT